MKPVVGPFGGSNSPYATAGAFRFPLVRHRTGSITLSSLARSVNSPALVPSGLKFPAHAGYANGSRSQSYN